MLAASEIYAMTLPLPQMVHFPPQYLLLLLFSPGDSLENDGNSNQKFGGPYTMTSAQIVRSFYCNPGIRGQYVNIRVTGENKKLEICEVLVNPNPTGEKNVAQIISVSYLIYNNNNNNNNNNNFL